MTQASDALAGHRNETTPNPILQCPSNDDVVEVCCILLKSRDPRWPREMDLETLEGFGEFGWTECKGKDPYRHLILLLILILILLVLLDGLDLVVLVLQDALAFALSRLCVAVPGHEVWDSNKVG